MLVVISPAKTLDFSVQEYINDYSQPVFLKESEKLIRRLRKLSPPEISELMTVNPEIAFLNFNRFKEWKLPFSNQNAKQALLAFKGDVYRSMHVETFYRNDFEFAQEHLRILSGLYGVLRPLDLIQAYRLEMGTRLTLGKSKGLYQFWDDKITLNLSKQLQVLKCKTLVNLASAEYFKSVKVDKIEARIITPEFREDRNGKIEMVSIYAKMARGYMSRYIIRNKITDPEQMKLFNEEGYHYNENLSTDNKWVFTR